jgi:hypothetical protein
MITEATTLPVPTVASTPEASPTPETVTPAGPTDTPVSTAGLKCIGEAASGGHPPEHTKDLKIQINAPSRRYVEVMSYFSQIACECDGLGFLGKFAEQTDWRAMVSELPTGIVFYSLTSLEHARQTADQWVDDVDWFAYEITLGNNTPEDEKNDPAQASRMALEFAREHSLVYMVTPGRPVTRRHAAELARYADVYGLQAYGERRESPDTFVQLVKDTSQKIRAVNPDILLFVAFSTHKPEDDPEVMYELITELLGHIDGVFIRTSGEPDSIEKLKTLVSLLREE